MQTRWKAGRGRRRTGLRSVAPPLGGEQLEQRHLLAGDDLKVVRPRPLPLMDRPYEIRPQVGPAKRPLVIDLSNRDIPSISAIPGPYDVVILPGKAPPARSRLPRPLRQPLSFELVRVVPVAADSSPPVNPLRVATPATNAMEFAPVPSQPGERVSGFVMVSGTRPWPAMPKPAPQAPAFDASWTQQDNDAARYAADVYAWEGTGFYDVGIRYRATDGFQASLFRAPDGTYYLAYRGTEFWSLDDWQANFGQHLGMETSQYEQAERLAFVSRKAIEGLGNNIILTGHSLGGSLASYAAERLGMRAIVFNPASVHPRVQSNHLANIRSHVVFLDPLSVGRAVLNTRTPMPLGPRGETIVRLPSSINTHGLDNFPIVPAE